MKRFLLGTCSVLALAPATQAADALLPKQLVEASRLDKDQTTMTQSASVIQAEEIARGGYTDVTEVLRGLAGIEFKQVGGPGQYNYLNMRGFHAGNVLVVIDGVVINRAGSGDVGNMLSQLDPASVSRIEVLRGPQTVLYGANATAGVISITTTRAEGSKLAVGAEAGSRGWKKLRGNWQHVAEVGEGKLRTSVFASAVDSDGLLKYEGFKDDTFQLALDYSSELFDAGLSAWYSDSRYRYAQLNEVTRTERPSHWGKQLPDPNAYNDATIGVYKAYLEHFLSPTLSHRLEAGWTETRRDSLDQNDGLLGYVTAPWDNFSVDWMNYFQRGDRVPVFDSGNTTPAHYKDSSRQFDYSLRYRDGGLRAIGGVEVNEGRARQWGAYGKLNGSTERKSFYLNGEYELAALGLNGLTLAGGLRYDDYDVWGEKTTGSVGASYRIGSFTLFANHGTSYRAPTLSQLFNPRYGNTSLKPESGRTSEVGIRQQVAGTGFNWEATAWNARVKDVVIYDSAHANPRNPPNYRGLYDNADDLRSRGLELSFGWVLDPKWTLRGNYTYTDSQTRKAGADYARTNQVARHKANLGVYYSQGPLSAGASVFYTDKRLDWTGRDWIDDYVRVDVSARYQVRRELDLYARIENLFDVYAQEGLGYKPEGIYGIVGIEYRFF